MEIQQGETQSLIENLMRTEGWRKLTSTQQQLIRASLLISQRAFRRRPDIRMISFDSVESPNAASENHVASEYCHTAVMALERGKLVTSFDAEENLRIDPHFFDTEDIVLSSKTNRVAQLARGIRKFGYPCVVQPGVDPKIIQPPTVHSFLVLGSAPDGKTYCWDKAGLGMPYGVKTLEDEYTKYSQFDHWGIRALRNLFSGKT